MGDKKTIILIGKTGNGKSTLANVLYDEKLSEGENLFKEGDGARSETKKSKSKEFEYKGVKHIIIDTPGICDTGSGKNEDENREREVYREIVEAIYDHSIKGKGLNQVLFVTNGRFTDEEKKSYALLNKAFFNEDIAKFTTVVRTNFPKFEKHDSCREDIEKMANGNDELAEMVNSCSRRVIHVNNPSIEVEDEDELRINQRKRNKSRETLLKHLSSCNEVYRHEFSKKPSDELKEMKKIRDKIIKCKLELVKHEDDINKAKNKITGLWTPAFGVTLLDNSEYGTGVAQQSKYKKELQSIDEDFKTLLSKEKEIGDFDSLRKLTEKHVAGMEKRLNWLRTQLDIELMFQEKAEQEALQVQPSKFGGSSAMPATNELGGKCKCEVFTADFKDDDNNSKSKGVVGIMTFSQEEDKTIVTGMFKSGFKGVNEKPIATINDHCGNVLFDLKDLNIEVTPDGGTKSFKHVYSDLKIDGRPDSIFARDAKARSGGHDNYYSNKDKRQQPSSPPPSPPTPIVQIGTPPAKAPMRPYGQ
ncbi:AIG1 family-domain-containing protein [Rhizophagus diaphanus]|nr:AIG1 family-domain-containing protein [Rhizophagus diaphanus] [Rhizophagus sp. MUCL 43196]